MKKSLMSSVVIVTILGLFLPAVSLAQIVPYKLTGSGVVDPTGGGLGIGSFYGPATSTLMGRLTYFAEATSITPIFDNGNLVGFDLTAIDTQTAADGSTIDLVGEGSAVLIPCPAMGPTWFEAYWDGDFTVVGGTKRFANVGPGTGPIKLWMYQEPFDLADPNTLRPFIFTKMGDIDLGRR